MMGLTPTAHHSVRGSIQGKFVKAMELQGSSSTSLHARVVAIRTMFSSVSVTALELLRGSASGPFEIEEADGSSSGQNEYSLAVLVHGSMWPRSGGGAVHHGHSVLGRRSLEWKMAARTKRSVDEANSRSSDMETGERTCRSRDVLGHVITPRGQILLSRT